MYCTVVADSGSEDEAGIYVEHSSTTGGAHLESQPDSEASLQ